MMRGGNYLGKEKRDIVHRDALWHKTVHAWLYNKKGEVYFQIRTDRGTLYTTASGHLAAGESVKEAFGREIKEEIGLDIDYDKTEKIDVVTFVMDRVKNDGSLFRDRVFANVYMYDYEGDISEFDFDLDEVKGVVKVNALEALNLFKKGNGKIKGDVIKFTGNKNVLTPEEIDITDFLVNDGETLEEKYGFILEKIIKKTEN